VALRVFYHSSGDTGALVKSDRSAEVDKVEELPQTRWTR
jgi:hypothetical protein